VLKNSTALQEQKKELLNLEKNKKWGKNHGKNYAIRDTAAT